MCSCHDWENLVKIRMSDEAPDKEDEYGNNDEEGQFSPYIIFLVSPCNF